MKDLILKLREQGKSYNEIVKEVGCSKSTVSYYSSSVQKERMIARQKIYRKRIKDELVEMFGGKCKCCGFNQFNSALDFHHIEPKGKDFQVSSKTISLERCIEEAKKCILVCSNCHRGIHSGDVKI